MGHRARLPPRLKDFDLADPAERRSFSRQVFAVVAPRYPTITRVLSFCRDSHWKRKLIRSLPDGRLAQALDLACGTGDLTLRLARRYPGGEVFGLDLTPEMLRRAMERVAAGRAAPGGFTRMDSRAAGMASRVHFCTGDMSRLDWEDGRFDVVIGGYALRYAPSLEGLLREVYRVMRRGGMAAFLDFSKPSNPVLQRLQLSLLRCWGDLWGWVYHRNPGVYGCIAESLRAFPDRRRLRAMLARIGFRDVRSELLLAGFTELLFFRK